MLEALILQLINNVVVPELADFIKKRLETTGQFPTKQELEEQATTIWQANKDRGLEFLNRPKQAPREILAPGDDGM